MTLRLIRIFKEFNIIEIKQHLLIYGALSGQCANCGHLGIALEITQCVNCQTPFKFLSFQNVREHLPKIKKIIEQRPSLTLVDYEDFKRLDGERKAQEFFK